jgi:hypothetical protein
VEEDFWEVAQREDCEFRISDCGSQKTKSEDFPVGAAFSRDLAISTIFLIL